MTILVDIDNTITNFSETLLRYLNAYYQTNYLFSQITSYDWFDKTFKDPWFVTDCFSFWDEVTVNPESVSAIEAWAEQNHKVLLVTASHFNSTLGYKIKKTLEAFNPKLINERNIVIAQDKSVVRGTIMIDDYEENLNNFNGVKVCYLQPWNRERSAYLLRTSDWNKIKGMIETIPFN